LSIKTNDKDFFRELINSSMLTKDIKLTFPIQNRILSPDDMIQLAEGFFIALASSGAVELFKILIKTFSDKKTSTTTTINNINIKNNYTKIFHIIELNVKQQDDKPNDGSTKN
jgi:hypothetical protein